MRVDWHWHWLPVPLASEGSGSHQEANVDVKAYIQKEIILVQYFKEITLSEYQNQS